MHVRALTLAAGLVLAAAGLAVPAAAPAGAATLTDAVTVNATSGLGTIPSGAIGLNTAVYDGDMNDTPIPGLLKAAGVDALRYPGGSYSDIFNWQTGTAAAGGYVAPGTGFSNFMSTAQSVGAQPIITLNYGTGIPGAGGRVGPGRRRHQQLRHPVLGSRQRGVRQRHLRGQLGDRLALQHRAERHPGDRRQRAVPDLQLRPGRVRRQREAVHLRGPRSGRQRQGMRGAHHSRLLAGRRDQLGVRAVLEPDRADRARLGHPVRDRALLPRRLIHRWDAHRPAGHLRDHQHAAQPDQPVRRDQQRGQRAGPGHRDQLLPRPWTPSRARCSRPTCT